MKKATRNAGARLVFAAAAVVSANSFGATMDYWRFEEASGQALDEADNRHGTVMGNAVRSSTVFGSPVPQTGAPNTQSMQFTGVAGDVVDMGTAPEMAAFGDFTLETFVRVDPNGALNFPLIAGKLVTGNFLDRGFELQARPDGSVGGEAGAGKWKALFRARDGGPNGRDLLSADLNFDTWYHLAAVREGLTLKLFVDGTQANSMTLGAVENYQSGLQHFTVGGAQTDSGVYGRALDGFVDEVRFSDAALSPGQFLLISSVPGWALNGSGDWNVFGNWGGGIPNGIDATAIFGGTITAPRTVFTDVAVTVGTVTFDNANSYLIAGQGSLTLEATSANAVVDVLQGTHKINLPLVIASSTDLNVASGATLKISDPVTVNSGQSLNDTAQGGTVIYESTITLQNGASINFGSSQHVAALTVGDNATATLQQNGSHVLESDNVSISSTGGKVDLKDNRMIFRGEGAGNWNGTAYEGVSGWVASDQLTTSMPDAANLLTTLAVATDLSGDTHAVYTYSGDSDVDGSIDGDDFASIDAGFSSNLKGYANGDFDYSGTIDADDYWLIDRAYSKQGAPFGAAAPSSVSAVPEPASLSLCVIAASHLLRRRKRV